MPDPLPNLPEEDPAKYRIKLIDDLLETVDGLINVVIELFKFGGLALVSPKKFAAHMEGKLENPSFASSALWVVVAAFGMAFLLQRFGAIGDWWLNIWHGGADAATALFSPGFNFEEVLSRTSYLVGAVLFAGCVILRFVCRRRQNHEYRKLLAIHHYLAAIGLFWLIIYTAFVGYILIPITNAIGKAPMIWTTIAILFVGFCYLQGFLVLRLSDVLIAKAAPIQRLAVILVSIAASLCFFFIGLAIARAKLADQIQVLVPDRGAIVTSNDSLSFPLVLRKPKEVPPGAYFAARGPTEIFIYDTIGHRRVDNNPRARAKIEFLIDGKAPQPLVPLNSEAGTVIEVSIPVQNVKAQQLTMITTAKASTKKVEYVKSADPLAELDYIGRSLDYEFSIEIADASLRVVPRTIVLHIENGHFTISRKT